jgi:lipoate-protein ligase A
VTYSICSSDGETFTSKLINSYRLISESLMQGLRRMGLKPCLADAPPDSYLRGNLPCFSYPARNEVEVNGKKIIGSAQKRAGSLFIQHGSIPLEEDEGLLNSVSFLKGEESLSRMTSLSRALGKAVSFNWAVGHFISGISEFYGVKLSPKILDDAEKRAISSIEKERYLNKDWTLNRKSGHM